MNIPFSRPNLSEDEVKMASKVIKSGWLTTEKSAQNLKIYFQSSLLKAFIVFQLTQIQAAYIYV